MVRPKLEAKNVASQILNLILKKKIKNTDESVDWSMAGLIWLENIYIEAFFNVLDPMAGSIWPENIYKMIILPL